MTSEGELASRLWAVNGVSLPASGSQLCGVGHVWEGKRGLNVMGGLK